MKNKFSWKIAGEAGDGILNAGMMFARMCVRSGLNVFATAEYPSLIRGGHNHLDVMVDEEPLFSHTKYVDVLVALNKESVEKHAHKISQDGGIIYDGDKTQFDRNDIRDDIKMFPIPLLKIADQNGGKIMRNVVAMGATVALIDFDIEIFNHVIRDNFGAKKGEVVANANITAAKAGYDYIKQNFSGFKYRLSARKKKNVIFLSGNEAIAAGAIKAGCKFLAAYPMTPATSVMTNMAAQEKNYNIVVKHTEDEIAAINMAIGASYAGVRSMVCTSGGGFCLMTEGLGLAAQTEVPLVIVEAQRPGPGTGMATHSGQGDLRFVLHASTDESPRVIIAPGDQTECFYLTAEAFNIAEKYQMPVIILTDKYLAESYKSVPVFNTSNISIERGKLLEEKDFGDDFKRYRVTEDGVSPRSIPSQKGGEHTASSYEHDEEGYEREEEGIRIKMHNKRHRKFENLKKELPLPALRGDDDADITIISWGSTKGPVLQAMKKLSQKGIKTNFCHIVYLSPFPEESIAEIIMGSKHIVVIENNKTSQLSGIIKELTEVDVDYKILKYDGRPFYPEEIVRGIKDILENSDAKEIVFSRNLIVEAK
ncbi:MAG: 2-oxoacid:acceptor oxidoreductase subunit alpha [Candidatus Aenigmarchaeota archaeon]|nr:2-oxoacid:acceptor oxidoreductase subunit alpha [Candidatus Aenigmarchaeota archaeon]MDI6722643.1 2-oxoacid:acceptor oxidoreductase subunit alpha [Candidatus Aenigmarchaeota archaeon]